VLLFGLYSSFLCDDFWGRESTRGTIYFPSCANPPPFTNQQTNKQTYKLEEQKDICVSIGRVERLLSFYPATTVIHFPSDWSSPGGQALSAENLLSFQNGLNLSAMTLE